MAMNLSSAAIVRRLLAVGLLAALVAALPAAGLSAPTAEATPQARGYWLVVRSERDGEWRSYVVRPDGTRLTPLVPRVAGAATEAAAVSRDGSTIAYQDSYEGPHEGIYVSRANGTGLRRVVQQALFGALSPNGKTLAFEYGSPSRLDIIGTDGRGRRRLGSGSLERIDWSPNGKALALIPYSTGSRNTVVVRPLRGRERTLARGFGLSSPSWSPDGRWIAYSRAFREDRRNGLYVVRPNGREPHRVAKGLSFVFSWSRDGKRLAFGIGTSGDVGIVGVNGRGFRRLHLRGLGLIDALRWSPDGRQLILGAPGTVRKEGTAEANRIWIVGTNGRGLRPVTRMVGAFDLVGLTRAAPVLKPAAPLLPSERVIAADTVATGTPIADLSADGSRVAFVVQWTAADCDHVVVWNPGTRALDRFTRPVGCPIRSGVRLFDVELAGSRAAWVSASGCGNFCDIVMRSATLAQRSPRALTSDSEEQGTDLDYHLRGDDELLVFNDRSRLVRIGGGSEKCAEGGGSAAICRTIRQGAHAAAVDSASAGRIAIRERDAVAVVDEGGALVRVFPFAPDEVSAARLDGDHLAVARSGGLDVYSVATGQGELQRSLPSGYELVDVDGGVAVLRRENSLILLQLGDGRSRTLTLPRGPVLADLEAPGLYYSYTSEEGSGRVVFVPRPALVP